MGDYSCLCEAGSGDKVDDGFDHQCVFGADRSSACGVGVGGEYIQQEGAETVKAYAQCRERLQ